MKEKGDRVTQLEQVASRKDVTVDQLKYIVMNQTNSVDAMRYRFNMAALEREYAQLKAKEKQRIKEDKESDKSLLYHCEQRDSEGERSFEDITFL